jgi:hypothetical protein
MTKEIKNAALTAAMAVALAGSAAAQSTKPGPPPPPPNANGPVAIGTVQSVSVTGGKITLSTQQGGTRVVYVTGATVIATETALTAGSLKVGDAIHVDGVPGGIIASSIVVGNLSKILPPPPPPPGPGPSADTSSTGTGTTPPPPPPSGAFATGTVMSLNPLTIAVNQSGTVLITIPAGTTINKLVSLPLSSVKVGDRIVAAGTPNSDGSLLASTVAVNIAPPAQPGS